MANHPNRSSERVTIRNLNGENERVTLPQPEYEASTTGQADYGTGVWITGIYRGTRTGRMFLRSHSIWQRSHNDGRCVGTTYREIDLSEYLGVCDIVGIEPLNVAAPEV